MIMPVGGAEHAMVDLERSDITRRNRARLRPEPPPVSELLSEAGQFERLVRLESDMDILNQFLPDLQQQNQSALTSIAEVNQRFVSHFEESKRLHQRMDEQDRHVENLRHELVRMEKVLLELKLQNQALLDFTGGVKKAGWIAVTAGGVILWWAVQKWLEHAR